MTRPPRRPGPPRRRSNATNDANVIERAAFHFAADPSRAERTARVVIEQLVPTLGNLLKATGMFREVSPPLVGWREIALRDLHARRDSHARGQVALPDADTRRMLDLRDKYRPLEMATGIDWRELALRDSQARRAVALDAHIATTPTTNATKAKPRRARRRKP